MVPKAFDFIKFAKLFYSGLTLSAIEDYCMQYPTLKPEAILFVGKKFPSYCFLTLNYVT